MRQLLRLAITIVIASGLVACGEQPAKDAAETKPAAESTATPERPSDADLVAFKVYHHAVYLVATANQAGGTNKLHHTTELPTEGTDPVVTPALDHLYTKAIIDLHLAPLQPQAILAHLHAGNCNTPCVGRL